MPRENEPEATVGEILMGLLVIGTVVMLIVGYFYNEHLDAQRAAERAATRWQNVAETNAYKDCLDNRKIEGYSLNQYGNMVPEWTDCER